MNSNPTPGLHYVGRDGQTVWHLETFFATGLPGDLPRPERDVLVALLRFCLDGIGHMNATERWPIITPPSGASD
jgi:hypothetical protein